MFSPVMFLLLAVVFTVVALLGGITFLLFRWNRYAGVTWLLLLFSFAAWDVHRGRAFRAKGDELDRALPSGTPADAVLEYLEDNQERLKITGFDHNDQVIWAHFASAYSISDLLRGGPIGESYLFFTTDGVVDRQGWGS